MYNKNSITFSEFFHSREDASAENPYNTTFMMKVVSACFVGMGEWECDIEDLVEFIEELSNMYGFKSKHARLESQGYDSYIEFEMNSLGHMVVSGNLVGGVMNSLTFAFEADQASLYMFIKELNTLVGSVK